MYSCVGVAYMVLAGVGDSRLDLKMVPSLKLLLPSWGDAPPCGGQEPGGTAGCPDHMTLIAAY